VSGGSMRINSFHREARAPICRHMVPKIGVAGFEEMVQCR
jgi:hypothetical protein